MHPKRTLVFLPCHTLDDFPTWLEEPDADELLAAWTAAWHPVLLAAIGRLPDWASVDSPPETTESLLIVPAAHDDRLHGGGFPPSGLRGVDRSAGGAVVRRLGTRAEIVEAAIGVLEGAPIGGQEAPLRDDFYALGLAWLWSELLARRMRSSAGIDRTDFPSRAVEAARLAVQGREDEAREALRECFGLLESSRKRYYPVEIWLVDLILLAESTPARSIADALASPLPAGFVASGKVIDALASGCTDELRTLGSRIAAGQATGCGGMWDDQPLGHMTAEALRGSFDRGMAAWRRHVGAIPRVFARRAGAGSALLAQVLDSFGYAGAVWQAFDGSRLPSTGGSRMRWEACRGRTIELLARPAADARTASTGISLYDTLGDILDHDHAAILPFAHYPGTAAEWFGDLRRIAVWSDVFGRFIAPQDLFPQTAAAATRLDLGPDRFPDEPPRFATDDAGNSPLEAGVVAAGLEADALLAAASRRFAAIRAAVGPESGPLPEAALAMRTDDRTAGARSEGWSPSLATPRGRRGPRTSPAGMLRWLGGKRRRTWRPGDLLPLDNGHIRVEIHPLSGGILALRLGEGLPNRLSQRLSLRTTRPVTGRWEDPLDRSDYAQMIADAIEPLPAASGSGPAAIAGEGAHAALSRGRLCDAGGRSLGRFLQRVTLLPGLPLAEIEIEIELSEPIRPLEPGQEPNAWFERYAACRFAWNENDPVELFRGLHTQAVQTERTIFASPFFLELREGSGTLAAASRWTENEKSGVTILPLGLSWHVRSSPHMLDTLLLAAGERVCIRRLAVGLGIERPWELAAGLLAQRRSAGDSGGSPSGEIPPSDGPGASGITDGVPLRVDPPARLTGGEGLVEGGRSVGLRLGVLATGAAAARPRLFSAVPLQSAHVVDAAGRRLRDLEISGGGKAASEVVVPLDRHEWALVEIRWKSPVVGEPGVEDPLTPEPTR